MCAHIASGVVGIGAVGNMCIAPNLQVQVMLASKKRRYF